MLSAISTGVSSKINPFAPSIKSIAPSDFAETHGTPNAIASSNTIPNDSTLEGCTIMSACLIHGYGLSSLPCNITSLDRLYCSIAASRKGRISPSPIIFHTKSICSFFNSRAISIISNKFFSFDSRLTVIIFSTSDWRYGFTSPAISLTVSGSIIFGTIASFDAISSDNNFNCSAIPDETVITLSNFAQLDKRWDFDMAILKSPLCHHVNFFLADTTFKTMSSQNPGLNEIAKS